MWISVEGNSFGQCVIASNPKYQEEVGEHKSELTTCNAKAKQSTPDGVQTVSLTLFFWSGMAIPAMKLKAGTNIMVAGRSTSREFSIRQVHALETKVYVDWWEPRNPDPLGIVEELKVRHEFKVREDEMKILFAQFLTQSKGAILTWMKDWFKENIAAVKLKKKEENGNDNEQG